MPDAVQHTTPKIFSIPLIERVGSIGQVLSEFLDSERSTIQSELKEAFPDAESNAVDLLLNAFVTVDGTKRPLKLEEIQLQQLTREQLLFCLNRLERGRILRLDDDTYELAHDTLAGHIHGQRSAEEIGLLEAAGVVKNRWKDFEKTQTLMNAKEVDLVSVYIDTLEERKILTPEELSFVRRSIADVRRKRRARQITIAAIMLILGATTVWALRQQSIAKQATAAANLQLEQTILERQRANENRYRADLATYEQLIEKAVNLMDAEQPDYEGARELLLQAEEVARGYEDDTDLDIDNDGERARQQAVIAEDRIPLKDRFNKLMEDGLRLESEGYHRYMDALRTYREALRLDYNNYSAQVSIDVLMDKFPIAFESLRKDGDIYFDLGDKADEVEGFRLAKERYEQALRIRPVSGVDREHVVKRVKECAAKLN